MADEHFPGATEIVDSMRAKKHLYDVAKQALGEDARDAVETWVNATETPLYNGETSQVITLIQTCLLYTSDAADE